jgi:adenosylhomocysteine nucleosidase
MKYLLVALETEVPDIKLPDDYTLMITGVGKINATVMATIAAGSKDCECIINYGTAGTFNPKLIGKLHRIGTVKQRDMDTRPQALLGVTPFEDTQFNSDLQIYKGSKFTLSTGDNFVKEKPELESDFVDMEGYAIAKVAGMFNKPCMMLKYASDLADDKATEEWQANQAKGKDMFLKWLDELEKNIQELKDE